MGMMTGFKAIGNYAGAGTDQGAVDVLLNLIPNPDTGIASNGATGVNQSSYLDEMSPQAAAQLRVELAALRAAIGVTNTL